LYIELHARSAFSFLEGASLPEELIGVCQHFQMPAMALLDTDGVYGAPRFHLAANKIGIKAHIGAEVTCAPFAHIILSGAGAALRAAPAALRMTCAKGAHVTSAPMCALMPILFAVK
jgi:DNA polymerase III alpha subunit